MIVKEFGKIVDSKVVYAKTPCITEQGIVINAKRDDWLAAGYKDVVDVAPEVDENHIACENGYKIEDDKIVIQYDIIEKKNKPRIFSKLKLEVTMMKMGVLNVLDSFLYNTKVEGTQFPLKRFYDSAQEVSEENDMFEFGVAKFKEFSGFRDDVIEKILNDSVKE